MGIQKELPTLSEIQTQPSEIPIGNKFHLALFLDIGKNYNFTDVLKTKNLVQ